MAERRNRKYTEAFRVEALALLERGEKSATQIEEELGISRGLLLKWQARYQRVGKKSEEVHLEPSDLEAAKAEIRRLQRKLLEVEEEREILKKAMNIFSRARP
jgi:transposase